MESRQGPLAGVRVLDLFWLIAGPLASRVFADFGAEVIKVESAQRIDRIRNGVQPPGVESLETSGVFADCNLNKLSVTVNLNSPGGLDLIRELVQVSDVVTNNFSGDRMERWGLGYEQLCRIRPDIIAISVPVMGSTGPYRRYGAYGNGVIALGGLSSITGFAHRPPVGVGPLYPDFVVPYFGATALLAALHRRRRTGQGCFIDMAQFQATASQLGPAILNYTENGSLPVRAGNRSQYACPHGAFRCAGDDSWCAIAVESDAQWRALCEVIGRQDLLDEPWSATLEGRKVHEDEIESIVEGWTTRHNAAEAMRLLQARGVPAGVVQNLREMLEDDPQLGPRFGRVARQGGPEFTVHRQPVRLVGYEPPMRPPPIMGEHTHQVVESLLGRSAAEINQLTAAGALE